MTAVGIRELKDNLSKYVRDVERGKRIAVTMHGRVVAELVPSGTPIEVRLKKRLNRYEQLVAEGVIHPAVDNGDPFEGADLEPVMAPGEAVALLDWLRGEE